MTDLLMPKLGLTMTEATIVEWLKRPGDPVREGEPLFNFETEKSTLEFEAPAAGILTEIRVQAGETVPCYAVVGVITQVSVTVQPDLPPGRTFRASPRAKKAARDRQLDLTTVSGTGLAGRITEADVLRYRESTPTVTPLARRVAEVEKVELKGVDGSGRAGKVTRADVERAAYSPSQLVERGSGGEVNRDPDIQPFSAIRTITARRMAESTESAPQVTLTTEADAVEFVKARQQLNQVQPTAKISYNALLVAMCARALRDHPALNASYTAGGLAIHASVNIGVAVETARGLLVPVLHDAGRFTLNELQDELDQKIARVQSGSATPVDFQGGTFTITNLGAFDIDFFTPIVALPQAAILGVGRIVARAVPYQGQVAIREQVALSLTFDHRAMDGAPAARFLKRIKEMIENPYGLLIR